MARLMTYSLRDSRLLSYPSRGGWFGNLAVAELVFLNVRIETLVYLILIKVSVCLLIHLEAAEAILLFHGEASLREKKTKADKWLSKNRTQPQEEKNTNV